ncbi:hypothetical protein, partial [Methyloterricola oryzae]|uniref:hypothetical protein n=1 Tax=Methyloterricola oryzae TaxID=1495050 RepID=UPI001F33BCD9
MDLRGIEPESGQFVSGDRHPAIRLLKAIAPQLPVPDDGGTQPVAQVFQVPLEGGDGDVQFVKKA